MNKTGYVKFRANCLSPDVPRFPGLEKLNRIRSFLRQQNWLGVDEHGIGFGNVSMRDGHSPGFFITGSATGAKSRLQLADMARVTTFDLTDNSLEYCGAITPSAESLTHAAVYTKLPDADAVIHAHSDALWQRLMRQSLATATGIEYGTPEMAQAVIELLGQPAVREARVFAMAGHPAGVIAFGRDLSLAGAALQRVA